MESGRPFLCGKCGNYYVPVETEGVCRRCDEGTHAPHRATGVIDCHFGHESATKAEVQMLGILATVKGVQTACDEALGALQKGTTSARLTPLLTNVEQAFAKAERSYGTVPEILRWSGVFEMPGMTGENPSARYKSVDALEDLVHNNRRPPEDLVSMRRSIRNCNEMADEAAGGMAAARVTIGQVRRLASEPVSHVGEDRTPPVSASAPRKPRPNRKRTAKKAQPKAAAVAA